MAADNLCLPLRVVKQPSPAVYSGGDCGACVIAGLVGCAIEEAYGFQDPDMRAKGAKDRPTPFGWRDMAHTLKWRTRGIAEVIADIPMWPHNIHEANQAFGYPSWQQNLQWLAYVRMALRAGFYGVCSVSHDGAGPLNDHDHWVMVCGARESVHPIESMPGASRVDQELLISCSASAPDGKWIDHLVFLKEHGGYNIILVRPSK